MWIPSSQVCVSPRAEWTSRVPTTAATHATAGQNTRATFIQIRRITQYDYRSNPCILVYTEFDVDFSLSLIHCRVPQGAFRSAQPLPAGFPQFSTKRITTMYPGRNFPPRRQNRRENVNESIRVREVRAVFPDGTTEVMPTSAALRKAQELGLDLVLIAPTAVPPVAKAVDFGHYQYDLKKKQHDAKKKQHVVKVKELKFRPNTDDHDYDFKKNNAIRFLQEGNRVKAVVQFRGREIAHADLGKKLLMRLAPT